MRDEHLVYRVHLPPLLLFVQRAGAVEVRKTFVEHVEALHYVAVERLFIALHQSFHVEHLVPAALFYGFGKAGKANVAFGGHGHAVAVPVDHLICAQLLHVLDIVGIVINFDICAVLIETFYEHTLFVEVRKGYRPDNFVHAQLPRPLEELFKQRLGDFEIVDDVEASKAQLFETRLLICAAVPDAGYPARDFAVLVGKEHFAVGKAEGVVDVGVELGKLIGIEIGRGIGIAPV